MLWGNAAEAKSSLVKQYAESINHMLIDLRPALMADPGDLTGMPRVIGDPDDPKNIAKMRTTYVMPQWFPTDKLDNLSKYKGAVLFLDEFNRMDQSVFHAIFQLIYDRRIMDHVLPESTFVVLAGNPPTEDYQVSSLEDEALWTRFAHFNVAIDQDEWIKWALKNNINEDVISYLGANPKMARHEGVKAARARKNDQSESQLMTNHLKYGRPNRRTWEMLSKFITACLNDDKGRILWGNNAVEIAQGFIGETLAPVFINFRRDNKFRPLTGSEVLDNYKEHKDRMQGICGKHDKNIKGDSLSTTIHMVINEISKRWTSTEWANAKNNPDYASHITRKPEIAENFIDFLGDLPHDHRAMLNDAIHKDQPGTTPGSFMHDFAKWMKTSGKVAKYTSLIKETTQVSQFSQQVLTGQK